MSLIKQVPPRLLKELEFTYQEYCGNGDMTLIERTRMKLQKYLPTLLEQAKITQPSYTEDQRIAGATRHLLKSHNIICAGIARRMMQDDPGELVRSVSLEARLSLWTGTRDECDCFLNFTNYALPALAVGDWFLVHRYVDVTPHLV